jgi:hypothetical protein
LKAAMASASLGSTCEHESMVSTLPSLTASAVGCVASWQSTVHVANGTAVSEHGQHGSVGCVASWQKTVHVANDTAVSEHGWHGGVGSVASWQSTMHVANGTAVSEHGQHGSVGCCIMAENGACGK